MARLNFGVLDYILFCFILVVPITIAVVVRCTGGKQKTTSEYLVGNGHMSVVPVGISLGISFISAITILGYPAESYFFGVTVSFINVGIVISLVITTMILVPVYHPLQLTSPNQYIMVRFNSKALLWFGLSMIIAPALFVNGIFLFGPAVMMQQAYTVLTMVCLATGIPVVLCIVMVGVAGTVYTALGGFRGVIWTDVFQAAVIVLTMCLIMVQGVIEAGGLSNIIKANIKADRFIINTHLSIYDRQTFWGLVCTGVSMWTMLLGCSPMAIQRITSLSTKAKAVKMVLIGGCLQSVVMLLCIACGTVIFGFYALKGCDPYKAGYITNINQIIVFFSTEMTHMQGLKGLFLSALTCGSLSNLSSYLSGLTAMIWMDVVADKMQYRTEERKATATKIITMCLGICSFAIALLIAKLDGTLLQAALSLMGCSAPAVILIYCVSCLIPRLNWKSTFCGCVAGVSLVLWIKIGSLIHNVHTQVMDTDISNCTGASMHVGRVLNTSFVFPNSSYESNVATSRDITTNMYEVDNVAGQSVERHGLLWLYHISYHFATAFGIVFAIVIAVVSSYVPGFSSDGNNLVALHPLVRRFATKKKTRDTKESEFVPLKIQENDMSTFKTV